MQKEEKVYCLALIEVNLIQLLFNKSEWKQEPNKQKIFPVIKGPV